jgi:hypothetical protein
MPSGSQPGTGTVQRHFAHLVAAGLRQDYGSFGSYTCPSGSTYFYCYYIQQTPSGAQFQQGWCESQVNDCDYLESGTWHWRRSHVYNAVTLAQTNKIRDLKWSPQPGNPSTNTITVSASVAPTAGMVGYYFNITACSNNSPNGKGYCDGPYPIGIVILSGSGS